MQPKTSNSRINRRAAHRLSRRGFLTAALVAFVGLSVTLAGCSPDDGAVEGVDSHMAIVDAWIEAVNAEDLAQFEKLHTEPAEFHSYLQKSPSGGRENLWDTFSQSNASPMQKIYMLGQGDLVCLQVTATDSNSSFLYVFRFEGDLIAQVHEYWATYDLSDVPLFDGAEITTDDSGLSARIDVLDSQLDALNDRDFTHFSETLHDKVIQYEPFTKAPIKGPEGMTSDVQSFTQSYPTVEWSEYRAFGHGNLVCQQVAFKNPNASLGHVAVFEGDKISRFYQYYSDALLSR